MLEETIGIKKQPEMAEQTKDAAVILKEMMNRGIKK